MNWVDCAILAVIVLSALISLFRGFMREALSLIGWVAAVWVALTFARFLAPSLSGLISVPSLRLAAAFMLLFVAALVLAAVVNYLVAKLVQKTGLAGSDRMLGIVFGAARGVVIVAVLVLLAELTTVPQDPWWRESMLLKHFEVLAAGIRDVLPTDLAAHFSE